VESDNFQSHITYAIKGLKIIYHAEVIEQCLINYKVTYEVCALTTAASVWCATKAEFLDFVGV
jgi:hypothetical protein